MRPVMQQQAGRRRMVYLYSNVVKQTAVFKDMASKPLPKLPLVDGSLVIRPDAQIALQAMKTSDLVRFKDAYLSKQIAFGSGDWAFAVMIDGKAAGFLEYALEKCVDKLYVMADFAVSGTRYARLSKLIVMLMIAGETRKALERVAMVRKHSVITTAFTDRAVSMKYRGVLELVKRGETRNGQKFLNYAGEFNAKTWQETLREWLTKHGSQN
jgi:hypothetical protein